MILDNFVLVVTWWLGRDPYCEMCQHYHSGACLCPDCGRPVPCGMRGGSHPQQVRIAAPWSERARTT